MTILFMTRRETKDTQCTVGRFPSKGEPANWLFNTYSANFLAASILSHAVTKTQTKVYSVCAVGCFRWCTTNQCVQEWWAVSVSCYHWPYPIVSLCSQRADTLGLDWTANKHPCVAWEQETWHTLGPSVVPRPLEPLIVDCFWWANTEVRL